MTTDDLAIVGGLFDLDAKGSIGFDAVMDRDATIYFNAEFSAAFAETVPQLKTLYDNQGRLVIPLDIKGPPDDLKVFPDMSELLKNALKGTVLEKANELLNSDDAERGETDGEKKENNSLKRLRKLLPRQNR